MPSHAVPRDHSSGSLVAYSLAALLALGCTHAWALDLLTYRSPATFGAPATSPPYTGATGAVVNGAALLDAQAGSTVTLAVPDGRRYTYVLERKTTHSDDSVSWVGVLQGFGNDYRLILTYSAAASFGKFITPDGTFMLDSMDGQTWLVDLNASNLQPFRPDVDDAIPPPLPPQPNTTARPPIESLPPSPQTTIEVLVLYSPGLVTRLGSVAAVNARINYLVTISNLAYFDSDVSIVLRLLQSTQIAGVPDNTDNQTELTAITNSIGVYSGVGALRDAIGADLVTLMRPFTYPSQVSCGNGWLGGYQLTDISGYAAYGYSVIGDGSSGAYYCLDHTYAHELGHNMGSHHDRVTVGGSGDKGAYPYSFGYGVNGSFTTIMGYTSSFGAPQVGKFSNPNLLCMGVPCGVPASNPTQSADNAQSLNNTRGGVASWRAPVAGSLLPTSPAQQQSMRAAGGFPVVDWFDIAPRANRSYELQILNVSTTTALTGAGSVARYDTIGLNQLQDSGCLDAGCTTRTLRWVANADAVERVRVTNGATIAPAGGTYSTLLRETTLYCTRWSEAGGQLSVLAVQRAQSEIGPACDGTVFYYDANGALLASQNMTFAANKVNVQVLAAVPGLAGNNGSLYVAHTCGIGGIKGIVTALEPATGYSFGTPCSERTR